MTHGLQVHEQLNRIEREAFADGVQMGKAMGGFVGFIAGAIVACLVVIVVAFV